MDRFRNVSALYISKITRYLPQSTFAKGVMSIASGTLLGQFIVFLLTPVITRLYSPNDYGVLAVYASLLGVITVIGCMRYELAIPLPQDDQAAANILILALIICLGVSTLSGLALWVFGDHLVRWTKTSTLKPYLWLLPLGIFCASSYTVFSYWAVRKSNYVKLGSAKLMQGTTLALTQITLGVMNIKPLGLLAGLLAGHTSGLGALASSAWHNGKHSFMNVSVSGLLQAAKRYRRFPLFSSYTSLMDTIGSQAPAFLLAILYGPSIAGWYALSLTAVCAPLVLIGKSVDQVYLGEASRLISTDHPGNMLLSLYLNTARKMLLLGLLFVVPLFLFSPVLFEIFFGSEWRESGHYAQVMSPMVLAQFVVAPISQTLNVIERQDIQLIWVIIWLLSVSGSFAITHYLNLSAIFAIALLSVVMALSYLLHFLMCIYMLRNMR